MTYFWELLSRDLLLAWRQGVAVGLALGFFLMVIVIAPLGLSSNLELLSQIAPGLLWIALLLALLLSHEHLFQYDFDDGSLEILVIGPLSLELVVMAKATAHWLTITLPLIAIAPFLALLLNLPAENYVVLIAAMVIGSPALSFLGTLGAALTVGVRRGGMLLSLLILPLYVPILIFGASTLSAAVRGEDFTAPLLFLSALSLAAIALSPFAAAAAIRANLN